MNNVRARFFFKSLNLKCAPVGGEPYILAFVKLTLTLKVKFQFLPIELHLMLSRRRKRTPPISLTTSEDLNTVEHSIRSNSAAWNFSKSPRQSARIFAKWIPLLTTKTSWVSHSVVSAVTESVTWKGVMSLIDSLSTECCHSVSNSVMSVFTYSFTQWWLLSLCQLLSGECCHSVSHSVMIYFTLIVTQWWVMSLCQSLSGECCPLSQSFSGECCHWDCHCDECCPWVSHSVVKDVSESITRWWVLSHSQSLSDEVVTVSVIKWRVLWNWASHCDEGCHWVSHSVLADVT